MRLEASARLSRGTRTHWLPDSGRLRRNHLRGQLGRGGSKGLGLNGVILVADVLIILPFLLAQLASR